MRCVAMPSVSVIELVEAPMNPAFRFCRNLTTASSALFTHSSWPPPIMSYGDVGLIRPVEVRPPCDEES